MPDDAAAFTASTEATSTGVPAGVDSRSRRTPARAVLAVGAAALVLLAGVGAYHEHDPPDARTRAAVPARGNLGGSRFGGSRESSGVVRHDPDPLESMPGGIN